MTIPERLEDWSFETVSALCGVGRVETDRYDFKLDLPDAGSLTKACCAFANSYGGFIIFGVKDQAHKLLDPSGLGPNREIARDFGSKLKADPTIYFPPPKPIPTPRSPNVLYVFHVPLSPDRPHRDELSKWFWKRTNTGCEAMTVSEIRAQFMNYQERRDLLKMLFIELVENAAILPEIAKHALTAGGGYSLHTLDTAVLDRLLPDVYSLIQHDQQLVTTLMHVRREIRLVNTRARLFFNQVALPLTGKSKIIDEYNAYMRSAADRITPLLTFSMRILEERFQLQNPFE
ncbi:MAG: ATP-binding protein [Gemmataceae bacterium]|nr:ATP-binding protein [Gemmataceae bacterium]